MVLGREEQNKKASVKNNKQITHMQMHIDTGEKKSQKEGKIIIVKQCCHLMVIYASKCTVTELDKH